MMLFHSERHIPSFMALLNTLRTIQKNQNVSTTCKKWSKERKYIRIGGYHIWLDKSQRFHMKKDNPYFIGKQYTQCAYGCLNLSRLLLSHPKPKTSFARRNFNALQYNTTDMPLSTFRSKEIRTLYIEVPTTFEGRSENQHIETLYLNNLDLPELPTEAMQLSILTALKLWGNKLKTLPASISKLTNLEVVNNAQNRISEIPDVLLDLPHLMTICLQGVQNLQNIKQTNPQA